MKRPSKKTFLCILLILLACILLYSIIIYFLRDYYIQSASKNSLFRNNEFGDFIGGIINPIFTMLSTVSIIYLTFRIAEMDEVKAEKAIEIQKRLTLNQMRQNALESLMQKTNLYVYERNQLSIHSTKNKLHQKILTSMINEDKQESVIVWLIIMSELENFTQLKYLFSDLFKSKEFIENYALIMKVTGELCAEQSEMKFVKTETIGEYINIQQIFLTNIGDYIYSEF